MSKTNNYRKNERGGAGVKFLIIALVLFLVGHAAYNYIPVAYQGQSFKQEMETAVVQISAMPPTPTAGTPVDVLKAKLTRMVQQQALPPAVIDVKQNNNVLTAHVRYAQSVNILPFGIYTYDYEFDHTATPTGFLLKQ